MRISTVILLAFGWLFIAPTEANSDDPLTVAAQQIQNLNSAVDKLDYKDGLVGMIDIAENKFMYAKNLRNVRDEVIADYEDAIEEKELALDAVELAQSNVDGQTVTVELAFDNKEDALQDKNDASNRSFQLTLHLPIEQLIPFSEKIGFRYCCHKSQRLEAGVSYRRLREEVCRQHNWLVNRVDEITHFKEIKSKNPDKTVPTKSAIIKAVEELKKTEGLLHDYAIPSTHDITDHLIKGTEFGKFTSKSFPTAEQFMEKIGALSWFLSDDNQPKKMNDVNDQVFEVEETEETELSAGYGVHRECASLPTMNLEVVSRINVGPQHVYDISVEDTHSFLANGIVAHNCMVSHGAARFTRERLYDVSDKFQVHVCSKCGMVAAYNDALGIHCCKMCDNRTDFAYVEIPYSCKLLFQELQTMNVVPRIMTE